MKRIKYVSRFARNLAAAEIDQLVAHAAEKNQRLGITGVLVTTGRLFYQVIEGPDQAIDDLFHTISADRRHMDVLLLRTEHDVDERFFPDWTMQRVDLDAGTGERLEPLREILSLVVDLHERADRLASTLERAIWRELASST